MVTTVLAFEKAAMPPKWYSRRGPPQPRYGLGRNAIPAAAGIPMSSTRQMHRSIRWLGALCLAAPLCSLAAHAKPPQAKKAADPKQAAERYQAACDAKDWGSCYDLGVAYEEGVGVAADPKRAAELYERGCKEASSDCCAGLAVLYSRGAGVQQDYAKATQLFKQLCDVGFAKGCYGLALAYEHGRGVTQDAARAIQLAQKACDGGHASACTSLGIDYSDGSNGLDKDLERAAQLLQKACDGGDAQGCTNLGVAYAAGDGVKKNQSLAVTLAKRGCDGGNPTGCYNYGLAYERGASVPRDTGKAYALFRQACDQGSKNACSKVEARRQATAATGEGADSRSLALFGVRLKGAQRAQLRAAFASGGLKPTREDDRFWVDQYDAQGVLDEATSFSAGYVDRTGQFAFASYDFESSLDPEQFVRIAAMVSVKYGRPSSRSGNVTVGPAKATWSRPDGMRIEVDRAWPDTTTHLRFLDVAAHRQMSAEIAAEKKAQERKSAAAHDQAF